MLPCSVATSLSLPPAFLCFKVFVARTSIWIFSIFPNIIDPALQIDPSRPELQPINLRQVTGYHWLETAKMTRFMALVPVLALLVAQAFSIPAEFALRSAPSQQPTITPPVSIASNPPPTTTGPVVTAWTVVSGDTGVEIASKVSVPFFAISSANPTVTWTALSIGETLIIPPSPTALAQVTGTFAKVISTDAGATNPKTTYTEYDGDGSTEQGWPAMSAWLSFDSQWNNLQPSLGQHCGAGVPDNSASETLELKNAILTVATDVQLDPRFVLAVVAQESWGCVRVQTTSLANPNPGLLQSFEGKGSCNHNGAVDVPCSVNTINQMIVDGAAAPVDGVTLVSALNQATAAVPGIEPAQAFYRAARLYNSGPDSLPPATGGDLGSAIDAAMRCYASDIANRLLGWSSGMLGPSPCKLDKKN